MPTNAAKTFEEFTTSDGRWKYGYAEYRKSIADLGVAPETASAAVRAAWPTLAVIRDALTSITKATTFASSYIFAIDPNGQKRIAGEWTPLQGGRAARDLYFNNNFEPAFNTAGITDVVRINTVIATAQAAPTLPVIDTLKKVAPVEVREEAASAVIPVLLIGGVVLWFLFKK